MSADATILLLADTAAWREWLGQNCSSSGAVMLTIARKGASEASTTITYDQALDEALCHGWIDSGGRSIDSNTQLFRFGPRKANSLWSKRNVGYVERLQNEGRMHPAGLAAIEAAKANGRWDSAYSASSDPPPEFFAALDEDPAAKATWDGLNKGNRWHIYFRMLNLKTQAGREKRIKAFVDMLAKGETPIPQKNRKKTAVQRQTPSHKSSAASNGSTPKAARHTRSGRSAPSYAGQA